MNTLDADITTAFQTELKIYMTQQLHRKGYLSDRMCADATELILKDAKKIREAKKMKPDNGSHTKLVVL